MVKLLSLPGLYLQKHTTLEPDDKQLEVAIIAMRAAMEPASTACYEGRYEGPRYTAVEEIQPAEMKKTEETAPADMEKNEE